MKIINLDLLPWKYNYDSDKDLPVLDSLPNDLSEVEFTTELVDKLPFSLFEKLSLKKVKFNTDITIDYDSLVLDSLETSGDIILYCSTITSDIIKCKKLTSFSSTLHYTLLDCDETDFKLTKDNP